MKHLIINADDFGFTRDVNAGIIHAHRHGVLTSTTLMANGAAFEDAVRWAKEAPSLDVGCHLVLVQGCSLLSGKPFPTGLRQLLAALVKRRLDIYAELRAQLNRIVAEGLRPTHLDSHKHTHIVPEIFRAVIHLAHEFEIPHVRLPLDETTPLMRIPCVVASRYYRRAASIRKIRMTDHFLGYRLTGSLTEQTLSATLSSLPEGTTELMCHPGFAGPELQQAPTRLKDSRLRELEALTAPAVRELINAEGIRLTSFAAE